MTSDRIPDLETKIAELERRNRLLSEGIKQAERVRQLWQQSVEELKRTKKALKASEERYDLAIKGANDGLWDWDRRSGRIYFSPRAVEMLGISAQVEDHTFDAWLARIHPEDRTRFNQGISDCVAGSQAQFEITARFHQGLDRYLWILCRGMAVRVPQSEASRLTGTTTDITERMHMEQQLKLGAKVIQATSEGVVVSNRENHIEAVNPAFTTLTGYTAEEAIGQNPEMLQSGRHQAAFFRAMWKTIKAKGHWHGEMWNRRKDGSLFVSDMSISTISDTGKHITHYVGIFSDITQRKNAEKRLQRMAYHDALTGLPNRSVFDDRLEQALRQTKRTEERLGVFFFDLDGFKQVNDTYGHEIGDRMLQETTRRLLACVRDEDTIARIGGDEFCAVMRSINTPIDAARVAARITDALNRPFYLNQYECRIGVSIGISLYPGDGEDRETLVKRADQAMYQAKRTGKNRFVFSGGAEISD